MNTLTYVPVPRTRILGIDPITKGFGFAVVEEDPLQLVDWGTAIGRRNNAGIGARLVELLNRYRPTDVVIEDPRTARLSARHVALTTFIHYATLAVHGTCSIQLVSSDQRRRTFAPLGVSTKQGIANALVGLFPELLPHLPPHRHLSQSEDARWATFDALSLALAKGTSGNTEAPPLPWRVGGWE